MRAFSEGEHLVGTVLVLVWGGMARQKQRLLAPGHRKIARAAELAARSIVTDRAVERAWVQFHSLGWYGVAISKCLHFMARGLGAETNPPVPIDNAAMRNHFYPKFRDAARKRGVAVTSWHAASWEGYMSHMSAIITWAREKGWTTTEVETTLFSEYWAAGH